MTSRTQRLISIIIVLLICVPITLHATYSKKPVRVKNLTVEQVRKYGATLQWDAPKRTEYYKVQLQDQNGTVLKRWTHHKKRVRALTKDMTLLQPGTLYRYRVRACNTVGCSRWSKTVSFITISYNAGVAQAILDLEAETYELINAYRTSQGLAELEYHDGMAAIAREHSQQMAEGVVEFGHDGFTERYDEMIALFATAGGGAENVAWMTERDNMAETAQAGWVASAGHRANIEGDYTQTGLGIAAEAGRYYFTQLFLYVPEE